MNYDTTPTYEPSILIIVNSNIKYQYYVMLIFSESTLYVRSIVV